MTTLLEEMVAGLFMLSEDEQDRAARVLTDSPCVHGRTTLRR
jgi:hypothetical protein